MSTTVTEQEKRFCRYQGIMCEYATEYGYCKITACAKRHEYVQNLKFGNALHGAYKGGDAEMQTIAKTPDYMQQSRQADMMLVDLNSKDGYLLDGKYKVNGCEDLTDGRVEVVRCKDCRHRVHDEERGLYYCEMYYGQGDVSDENFCQWGERREE